MRSRNLIQQYDEYDAYDEYVCIEYIEHSIETGISRRLHGFSMKSSLYCEALLQRGCLFGLLVR